MIKLRKLFAVGMICLLVGCGGTSAVTYSYTDSMTLPADMIGSTADIEIKGNEKMTLYYEGDSVEKINDSIEYTFETEVTSDDKEIVKGLLLDSFDTDEKGVNVEDKSTDEKIVVSVDVNLKEVDKEADIVAMFNMYASDFNEDGTYPLETLQNTLTEAGYEK